METFSFVGTCIDSFDADTMEYLVGNGLRDVSDLALIDERYINPAYHDAIYLDRLTGPVPPILTGDIVAFIPERKMIIIYKAVQDIHFFYE